MLISLNTTQEDKFRLEAKPVADTTPHPPHASRHEQSHDGRTTSHTTVHREPVLQETPHLLQRPEDIEFSRNGEDDNRADNAEGDNVAKPLPDCRASVLEEEEGEEVFAAHGSVSFRVVSLTLTIIALF